MGNEVLFVSENTKRRLRQSSSSSHHGTNLRSISFHRVNIFSNIILEFSPSDVADSRISLTAIGWFPLLSILKLDFFVVVTAFWGGRGSFRMLCWMPWFCFDSKWPATFPPRYPSWRCLEGVGYRNGTDCYPRCGAERTLVHPLVHQGKIRRSGS